MTKRNRHQKPEIAATLLDRWPSREQWAASVRTFRGPDAALVRLRVDERVDLCGTAEEIARALHELTLVVHMVPDHHLSALTRCIRKGYICEPAFPEDVPASGMLLVGRYRQAQDAEVKAARLEAETAPLDDAAWACELHRRAEFEARFDDIAQSINSNVVLH
jgi:hypothetical protein